MSIEYVPYFPDPIEGQALLANFIRTRRMLSYRDNDKVLRRIARGMPRYELTTIEKVGQPSDEKADLVIRGECISACAHLAANNIKVDLVYIDPPFASGADYAKRIHLRRHPQVAAALAQAAAELPDQELRSFEEKMYGDIWTKEDYLNWMYENLMAIKTVMSDNASIYVHLDRNIGHYVKILLDEIFGEGQFRSEIIWANLTVSGFKSQANNWIRGHDTIFYYRRNDDAIFNKELLLEFAEATVRRYDKIDNSSGTERRYKIYYEGSIERRRYLDESEGLPVADVWTDINSMQTAMGGEYLNYATQKPEALLERIIQASSDAGMVVADFFGGSGVTAAVAQRLGRRFIHADVGINSIQTARDRLQAQGAAFTLLEVQDGVALFRNPVQTMEKLRSLVTGLRLDATELDSFWAGAFNDTRLGLIPVYLPDLLDHTSKVLDIPTINTIINQQIADLPDKVKKVVVYYIDQDDPAEIREFIKNNLSPDITLELRDLKELLAEMVLDDTATFTVSPAHLVEITSFQSDRLHQKINAYNAKHGYSFLPGDELLDEDDEPTKPKPVKGFKPIEISTSGLELIEWVSADCTSADGPWQSDAEVKIDKNGYITVNGVKTKEFWDATLACPAPPLRLKIRSIAGDETVLMVTNGADAIQLG